MAATIGKKVLSRPAFFVCDIQDRFRNAIHQFPAVVATSRRMLAYANMFNIPVFVTEQNPKALGSTVSEMELEKLGALHVGTWPKTKFSMYIPEVQAKLHEHGIQSVVIFGIESHVCVLQTVLELLSSGYSVHVVADAVSSCNKEEIPIALASLRQAGAVITTSESLAFQLMQDAGSPNFKEFSSLVKAEKQAIANSLRDLCGDGTPKSAL
ncbi:Isochorismatase domain-containing protein 1 [Serendipita indica DSM 11827]|nr:Isochorismatase domain-containing protein 1 [Serendipita indica DSM 11827]